MNQYRLLMLCLSLVVALSACSKTSTPVVTQPEYSQEDFVTAVDDYTDDASVLMRNLQDNTEMNVLMSMPDLSSLGIAFDPQQLMTLGTQPDVTTQLLRDLSNLFLPRGIYTFIDDTWQYTGASQNLELRWTYEAQDVTLVLNWNNSSATQMVLDDAGNSVEVPTSASLQLTLDGSTVALLNATLDWYDATCGAILELSSIVLNGYIGNSVTLTNVSAALIDNTDDNDSVTTSGSITLADAGDSATFNWDISVNGTINRNVTCFIESITNTTSGSFMLELELLVAGNSSGLGISFDVTDIASDENGLTSISLANGVITIDSVPAVMFAGVLDDSDGDGIPGENVIVTFSDNKTTTLEAVLLLVIAFSGF